MYVCMCKNIGIKFIYLVNKQLAVKYKLYVELLYTYSSNLR